MEYKKMVLCSARHSHPAIDGLPAIFEDLVDPMDFHSLFWTAVDKLDGVQALDLYVTGLTPALVAVLNVCMVSAIPCRLWHYNRATNAYDVQVTATDYYRPQLKESGCL